MPSKRTGYAPWSLTREAGVQSATVEGTIEVPQSVQPTLSTGFVDEKGNWQGTKSNDEVFFAFTKHVNIPNGQTVLAPETANRSFIDMTGFTDIMLAVKLSNGGNCAITAVMGPDTQPFANLSPVNAAADLRGTAWGANNQNMIDLFKDSAETFTTDVWDIITIQQRLKDQKNLQFKITNNSGGDSDIEVAFMRLV